jgi:hypothetical protein
MEKPAGVPAGSTSEGDEIPYYLILLLLIG